MGVKQTEALTLALEALEWMEDNEGLSFETEIAAIKEALAEQALDKMAENARELGLDYEPIIERVEDAVGMGHNAWDMVKPTELAKAFHEALAEESSGTEQLKMSDYEPDGMHHNKPHKCKYPKCSYPCPDLPDCRDAEQSAQQTPIAYAVYHRMGGGKSLHWPEQHSDEGDHNEYQLVPLYTSPPASKPWVSLTDEELKHQWEIWRASIPRYAGFAKGIEAKLKEKNT